MTKTLLAATAAVLFGLAAHPAAGDSKEALKLGVEALQAKRWSDAERFFRAAIAERPQERVNRLLKVNYLPHYYLGIALAEQQRCRTALDSWSESQRQGEVSKSKLTGDLDQRIESCQAHLRQVANALSEVENLLDTVSAAVDSLLAMGQTPELAPRWNQGEPSLSSRQRAAIERFDTAKKQLEQGRTEDDLDVLGASKTLAMGSLDDLEATIQAARQELSQLNATKVSALAQLEQAEEGARQRLRSIRDLAPFPKTLGARVAAVERSLQDIVAAKASAGTNRLAALNDELDVALSALQRAARRPPGTLTRAAEAFLSGNYELVLEVTEDVDYGRSLRSKSHRCLLRAASRHALWILNGERDDILQDLASEEIHACAEIEPAIPPSPQFFSPRFIEFHSAALDARARAAEEESSLDPLASASGEVGPEEAMGDETAPEKTTTEGSR